MNTNPQGGENKDNSQIPEWIEEPPENEGIDIPSMPGWLLHLALNAPRMATPKDPASIGFTLEDSKAIAALDQKFRRELSLPIGEHFEEILRVTQAWYNNEPSALEKFEETRYGTHRQLPWRGIDASSWMMVVTRTALERARDTCNANNWQNAVSCAYVLGKAFGELRERACYEHQFGSHTEPKRAGKFGQFGWLGVAARSRLIARHTEKEYEPTVEEVYSEIKK